MAAVYDNLNGLSQQTGVGGLSPSHLRALSQTHLKQSQLAQAQYLQAQLAQVQLAQLGGPLATNGIFGDTGLINPLAGPLSNPLASPLRSVSLLGNGGIGRSSFNENER